MKAPCHSADSSASENPLAEMTLAELDEQIADLEAYQARPRYPVTRDEAPLRAALAKKRASA